jgi:pimeloyl-ACP methyl ester carboxylesterase
MRRRAGVLLFGLGALLLPLIFAPGLASSTPPAVTVLKTTLHFRVVIGPNNNEVCDIIGDLYRPSNASAQSPDPAILTTNGFGGSKNDQAYLGQVGAENGYVVLSYSGLGFGGSGCQITLDDPDYDGKAASQLISFLGGAPGIAFYDAAHSQAYPPINYVIHDAVAHNGVAYRYDPRVGMVGGSYGGEIQFATADVDPRLDTIIPIITWNDLSYSLTPNNGDEVSGVTSATPGVVKLDWPLLFFAEGAAVDGVEGLQTDPSRINGCPNFAPSVCVILAESGLLGYPTEDAVAFFRHASVTTYMSHITIPTLLIQGEDDTLFYLNEAAATYEALKEQHTPVQMIWQSWGHSDGTPAPGEFSSDTTVLSTYEGQRIFNWFDHYLKDEPVSTGPNFSYFRDWIPNVTSGPDTAQYANASSYPVGTPVNLYLSGTNQLVMFPNQVHSGTSLVLSSGPVPTSYSETSGLSSVGNIPQPNSFDLPATSATYLTGVLPKNVDVVGIPTLSLRLDSPIASLSQFLDPDGMVQLFAKLYDVAPNGTMTLIHRLVAAVRVSNADEPVQIQLAGIVHQFAAGHRLALTISATDAAYRNPNLPIPFSVLTSPGSPSVLTLPITN